MNIEPLSAILPNLEKISDYDIFFSSVSENYIKYKNDGLFTNVKKKAFYAYKISSAAGNFVGLIAGNSLSDVRNNHIHPHEKTLTSKEVHLQNLLTLRQAQIKPVLCTFVCPPSLHNFLTKISLSKPPVLSIPFENTNELHQLWEVSDPEEINFLKSTFTKDVSDVYIADGHHRSSAVLKLYDQKDILEFYPQELLIVFLPISDLKIYEYNRVVDVGQSIRSEEIFQKLLEIFHIKRLNKRVSRPKKNVLNMLLDGIWYKLEWKSHILNDSNSENSKLDTYLFNKFFLNNILGIEDIRRDTRITYVPGIYGVGGIKLMVNGVEGRIGFMLPKVKKSDLINISRNNLTMPPKSTWFEPRIKNGMVVIPFTSGT